MTTLSISITKVSSLLVPTVAIFGVLIARRQAAIARQQAEIAKEQASIAREQATTARNKLKIERFDRRLQVYDAARKALGHSAANGELDRTQQVEYLTAIQPAKWLFNSTANEFLSTALWGHFVDLELHHTMMRESRDPQEKAEHAKSKAGVLKNLRMLFAKLDEVCGEFLTLEH